MILNLLVPVLLVLLAGVESQTANMTEEECSQVKRNQTSSQSAPQNSTMTTGNMTLSWYENKTSVIEGELHGNQTSALVTEEDESFQEQENAITGRDCQEKDLEEFSPSICGADFHKEMAIVGPRKWCEMENIIRPYNDMSLCLEALSHHVGCYSPNPITQAFFLSIHSLYFHNCSEEDPQFVDAPHGLVVALTLVPVSLIPVLVYLVVWKSGV
ncbi:receptor activity-modifying protein 3 [Gasterosteus aculeatus]